MFIKLHKCPKCGVISFFKLIECDNCNFDAFIDTHNKMLSELKNRNKK